MDREFFKEYMNKLIALDDFVDKANEVGIDITNNAVLNFVPKFICFLLMKKPADVTGVVFLAIPYNRFSF